MYKNSPTFDVSNSAADNLKPRQQRLWRDRVPAWVRSPVWSGLLGALIIVGMIASFHQVVHGAVQQSASRHKVIALHAEASRRCNALQGQGASESCLSRLKAAYGDTVVQAQTTRVARHDAINPLSRSQ